MTKLLSIDPGKLTGFVLFESVTTFQIEISGTVPSDEIESWVDEIRNRLEGDSLIVIERLPTPVLGTLGQILRHVTGVLDTAFPNADHLLPGHWKPVTQNVTTPSTLSIIHERDAYRMGWYYLNYRVRTPW